MFNPLATAFNDERQQQNNTVFSVYNLYRLLLSLILFISFLFTPELNFLGVIDPELYFRTSIFYIFFNILIIFRGFLPRFNKTEALQYLTVTIIDIIILVIISYSCGGVSTGTAHLVIVPVAAGNILFQNRMGAFLAAVGTLAAFYSEVYLSFTLDRADEFYVQVGLLGLTLFAISLMLQYLSSKISQKELLTIRQAEDLKSLEEMNYQIIQRMRTGIIVVNDQGGILNSNSSAHKLLSKERGNDQFLHLPPRLAEELTHWQEDNKFKSVPIKLSESAPEIQASFSYLQPDEKSDVLIFLEDYSRLSSRAQQLKLISLGRLTASIAHEIRNPLGAISHAGQLLDESASISADDRRLLEIIETHSKRVNAIINNILGVSRNQDIVPQLINLNDWMEAFVEKFHAYYRDKVQIDLAFDQDIVEVRFNISQLEQILTNLCENGIHYSKQANGHPHIAIRIYLDDSGEYPVVDIIDDGPGISPEHREHIFEPFFTTSNSGTGLGLFICKEICEAYQAQISYHRLEQEKTCFRIRFAPPDQNIV